MAWKRGKRQGGGKQRHIDDYRELVLDGAGKDGLADALMALNQQAHANQSRLLPDEPPPVRLATPRRGSTFDPQAIGTEAARDLRRQMAEAGMDEPTHYYAARERAEVGEIDRTYSLGHKTSPKVRKAR
ncbi:MAG: hypothetical protein ACE149_18015 [Armatimonadota bacterium]